MTAMMPAYHSAIIQLRDVVTPDAGGDNTGPNYTTGMKEIDYAPIPRGDLGFGAPPFLGDDKWARLTRPRRANGIKRSGDHKIVWDAPDNQP